MGEARRIHSIVGKKGLEEIKENRHRLTCCNHVRPIIQPFHQRRVKLIYFDCFHGWILGAGVLCSEFRITEFGFISCGPPTFKISFYSKHL